MVVACAGGRVLLWTYQKSKDRKMSHQTPKDTVLFIGIGINSNNYNHLLSNCVCIESSSFNLLIKVHDLCNLWELVSVKSDKSIVNTGWIKSIEHEKKCMSLIIIIHLCYLRSITFFKWQKKERISAVAWWSITGKHIK